MRTLEVGQLVRVKDGYGPWSGQLCVVLGRREWSGLYMYEIKRLSDGYTSAALTHQLEIEEPNDG